MDNQWVVDAIVPARPGGYSMHEEFFIRRIGAAFLLSFLLSDPKKPSLRGFFRCSTGLERQIFDQEPQGSEMAPHRCFFS